MKPEIVLKFHPHNDGVYVTRRLFRAQWRQFCKDAKARKERAPSFNEFRSYYGIGRGNVRYVIDRQAR